MLYKNINGLESTSYKCFPIIKQVTTPTTIHTVADVSFSGGKEIELYHFKNVTEHTGIDKALTIPFHANTGVSSTAVGLQSEYPDLPESD